MDRCSPAEMLRGKNLDAEVPFGVEVCVEYVPNWEIARRVGMRS